jgi:hypothetical protein
MLLETFEHNGHTIEIHQDEDGDSPRNWDNFATMVCWHRRYNLGDEQPTCNPNEYEIPKGSEVLPLYLYDHSGITMSTAPFQCPWDSGQVGWIYVTPEQMKKEFNVKRLTKKHREEARKIMRGEVETYDMYLTGQVYGYVIDDGEGDSLWGMYGYDYCVEEAKRACE